MNNDNIISAKGKHFEHNFKKHCRIVYSYTGLLINQSTLRYMFTEHGNSLSFGNCALFSNNVQFAIYY